MWQVDNRTPFAAERGWVRDRNGAEVWLVAVKCTFDIKPDGATDVAADQPSPLRVPQYNGEPGASSLKYEADLVLTKPTTDVTVVGQAVLLPFSDRSPGTFTPRGSRGMAFPYPPPKVTIVWLWDDPILVIMLAVVVICPFGFLALPVSRRQAKVRYRHILRVTAYSSAFLLLPLVAHNAMPVLRKLDHYAVGEILLGAGYVAPWAIPPLLFIWWGLATSRYLRMRHPWGVGLAVLVMATLAAFLAVLLVYLET